MGEGEPAPAAPENLGPPEYTIKIFISGNSGSKEITNSQHRIIMILKSLGIKMEAVDISGNTIILSDKKFDGHVHIALHLFAWILRK